MDMISPPNRTKESYYTTLRSVRPSAPPSSLLAAPRKCRLEGTARTCRGAVGLGSGRDSLAVGGGGGALAHNDIVGVGEGSLAHATDSLASTRGLGVLPIGGEVERDEEDEV